MVKSDKIKKLPVIILCSIFSVFFFPSYAKVVRVEVTKTETYGGGKAFGAAGEYEKIYGQAFGEVDPALSVNRIIQDLQHAPRNKRGMVEYVSEFILLRPKDMSKCNGLLFLSVPNRGNVFPADTALLARGYVYLWCAWQGDVLAGGNRLTMKVPVATNNGKEITGKVRCEYQVVQSTNTLNLSSGLFTGITHRSYETVSLNNTGLVLTKRVHEADRRIAVPNSDWAFADCASIPFPGTPSTTRISLKAGFDPNYIYELIYTAKNPLVLGLGFAAIRDVASFLRSEQRDEAGNVNPLLQDMPVKLPIKAAIMQGVSQCSNFCRTFLQLGFNQDEKGKQVFDGVNAHIGPRRISLNVRFGRPGGGGMQREDHLFPGNEPPHSWDKRFDPISGITGGILESCIASNTCPKIMQTLSSTEYRQSRASLTTTDSYGKKDVAIPANVRIYLFCGTQHTAFKTNDPITGFTTNDNPHLQTLRALLIALEKWVLDGTEPPKSAYPTLADGTLVSSEKKKIGWPGIPGVPYTAVVNNRPLLNFGPNYSMHFISGSLQEPPKAIPSDQYVVLVPKVDNDGNEIGGIRNVNIRVPLGTYTGWSVRKAGFGEGDLASLNGMFIPFKETRQERLAAGDIRLSLEERYKNHQGYVHAVNNACEDLIKEGFLLDTDARQIIDAAERSSVLKK
jgi:hypothetical protein